MLGFRNTAAGVGDLDHDRAIGTAAAECDSSRDGVLDRVGYDARERLLEQVGIATRARERRAVDIDVDAVAMRKRGCDLFEERRDRHRRGARQLLTHLGPGQDEQGACEPRQPVGFACDQLEEVVASGWIVFRAVRSISTAVTIDASGVRSS